MVPTQKHSKGRGSKAKPKTDHSKAKVSRKKMGKDGEASMAKRPQGTAVLMPGGRMGRARGYPGA